MNNNNEAAMNSKNQTAMNNRNGLDRQGGQDTSNNPDGGSVAALLRLPRSTSGNMSMSEDTVNTRRAYDDRHGHGDVMGLARLTDGGRWRGGLRRALGVVALLGTLAAGALIATAPAANAQGGTTYECDVFVESAGTRHRVAYFYYRPDIDRLEAKLDCVYWPISGAKLYSDFEIDSGYFMGAAIALQNTAKFKFGPYLPSKNEQITDVTCDGATIEYGGYGSKSVANISLPVGRSCLLTIVGGPGKRFTGILENRSNAYAIKHHKLTLPDPDIEVKGNNREIAHNDTTPTPDDLTDFGSVAIGGEKEHEFHVANTRDNILLFVYYNKDRAVHLGGPHTGDFEVTKVMKGIYLGGPDTFRIKFKPKAAGLRTATVHIPSNDPDENPYTFTIQGTGFKKPVSDVTVGVKLDKRTYSVGDTVRVDVIFPAREKGDPAFASDQKYSVAVLPIKGPLAFPRMSAPASGTTIPYCKVGPNEFSIPSVADEAEITRSCSFKVISSGGFQVALAKFSNTDPNYRFVASGAASATVTSVTPRLESIEALSNSLNAIGDEWWVHIRRPKATGLQWKVKFSKSVKGVTSSAFSFSELIVTPGQFPYGSPPAPQISDLVVSPASGLSNEFTVTLPASLFTSGNARYDISLALGGDLSAITDASGVGLVDGEPIDTSKNSGFVVKPKHGVNVRIGKLDKTVYAIGDTVEVRMIFPNLIDDALPRFDANQKFDLVVGAIPGQPEAARGAPTQGGTDCSQGLKGQPLPVTQRDSITITCSFRVMSRGSFRVSMENISNTDLNYWYYIDAPEGESATVVNANDATLAFVTDAFGATELQNPAQSDNRATVGIDHTVYVRVREALQGNVAVTTGTVSLTGIEGISCAKNGGLNPNGVAKCTIPANRITQVGTVVLTASYNPDGARFNPVSKDLRLQIKPATTVISFSSVPQYLPIGVETTVAVQVSAIKGSTYDAVPANAGIVKMTINKAGSSDITMDCTVGGTDTRNHARLFSCPVPAQIIPGTVLTLNASFTGAGQEPKNHLDSTTDGQNKNGDSANITISPAKARVTFLSDPAIPQEVAINRQLTIKAKVTIDGLQDQPWPPGTGGKLNMQLVGPGGVSSATCDDGIGGVFTCTFDSAKLGKLSIGGPYALSARYSAASNRENYRSSDIERYSSSITITAGTDFNLAFVTGDTTGAAELKAPVPDANQATVGFDYTAHVRVTEKQGAKGAVSTGTVSIAGTAGRGNTGRRPIAKISCNAGTGGNGIFMCSIPASEIAEAGHLNLVATYTAQGVVAAKTEGLVIPVKAATTRIKNYAGPDPDAPWPTGVSLPVSFQVVASDGTNERAVPQDAGEVNVEIAHSLSIKFELPCKPLTSIGWYTCTIPLQTRLGTLQLTAKFIGRTVGGNPPKDYLDSTYEPLQYNVERARAEVAFLTQPPLPTNVRTTDNLKVRVQVGFAGTTLPLPRRTYQSGTLTVKLGEEQANCPTTPEAGTGTGTTAGVFTCTVSSSQLGKLGAGFHVLTARYATGTTDIDDSDRVTYSSNIEIIAAGAKPAVKLTFVDEYGDALPGGAVPRSQAPDSLDKGADADHDIYVQVTESTRNPTPIYVNRGTVTISGPWDSPIPCISQGQRGLFRCTIPNDQLGRISPPSDPSLLFVQAAFTDTNDKTVSSVESLQVTVLGVPTIAFIPSVPPLDAGKETDIKIKVVAAGTYLNAPGRVSVGVGAIQVCDSLSADSVPEWESFVYICKYTPQLSDNGKKLIAEFIVDPGKQYIDVSAEHTLAVTAAGAKTPVELVFVEDGDSTTPLTEPVPDKLQATVGFGYEAYVRVQKTATDKAAVTTGHVNLTVGGKIAVCNALTDGKNAPTGMFVCFISPGDITEAGTDLDLRATYTAAPGTNFDPVTPKTLSLPVKAATTSIEFVNASGAQINSATATQGAPFTVSVRVQMTDGNTILNLPERVAGTVGLSGGGITSANCTYRALGSGIYTCTARAPATGSSVMVTAEFIGSNTYDGVKDYTDSRTGTSGNGPQLALYLTPVKTSVEFVDSRNIQTRVAKNGPLRVKAKVYIDGTRSPLPDVISASAGALKMELQGTGTGTAASASCTRSTSEAGVFNCTFDTTELDKLKVGSSYYLKAWYESASQIVESSKPVTHTSQIEIVRPFSSKALIQVALNLDKTAYVVGETVNVTVVIGAPNVGWPHYASGQTFDIAVQDDPGSLQQATREKPDNTALTDCSAGLGKQPIQVDGETIVECAFKVTSAGGFQVFLHNVSAGDQNYNFDPDEQVSVQVTPAKARDGEQPAPLTILKIERSPQNTPQLTNADTLKWLVTFSRPVHPVSHNDFSVDGPPEVGSTERLRPAGMNLTVSSRDSNAGTLWEVTASGGGLSSFNGEALLGLSQGQTIRAKDNNSVLTWSAPPATYQTYRLDNAGPKLLSVRRVSKLLHGRAPVVNGKPQLVWRLAFSEKIVGMNTNLFEVQGSTATITRIEPVGELEKHFDIIAEGGDLQTFSGEVTLRFSPDFASTIKDTVGNGYIASHTPSLNERSYIILPVPGPLSGAVSVALLGKVVDKKNAELPSGTSTSCTASTKFYIKTRFSFTPDDKSQKASIYFYLLDGKSRIIGSKVWKHIAPTQSWSQWLGISKQTELVGDGENSWAIVATERNNNYRLGDVFSDEAAVLDRANFDVKPVHPKCAGETVAGSHSSDIFNIDIIDRQAPQTLGDMGTGLFGAAKSGARKDGPINSDGMVKSAALGNIGGGGGVSGEHREHCTPSRQPLPFRYAAKLTYISSDKTRRRQVRYYLVDGAGKVVGIRSRNSIAPISDGAIDNPDNRASIMLREQIRLTHDDHDKDPTKSWRIAAVDYGDQSKRSAWGNVPEEEFDYLPRPGEPWFGQPYAVPAFGTELDTITFDASALYPGCFEHGTVSEDLALSTSASLAATSATITIRQEVKAGTSKLRPDAAFGFSSKKLGAFSLTTKDGKAERTFTNLQTGAYKITADDLGVQGYTVKEINCDTGGTGNVNNRSVDITLDSTPISCTFVSEFSPENPVRHARQMIADYLGARNAMLLAHQPDRNRRIKRLNGQHNSADSNGSFNASFSMPLLSLTMDLKTGAPVDVRMDNKSVSFASSLSRFGLFGGESDRLSGQEAPLNRWDVWTQGYIARFDDTSSSGGRFGVVHGGIDYIVTPDTLIGLALQYDWFKQKYDRSGASIDGRGWMIGPYATMRFGDNLYLDAHAMWGRSRNDITPFGTYTDSFTTTRWLGGATLSGEFAYDQWTLTPSLSLEYIRENQNAYTSKTGAYVGAQTISQGQLRLAPRISYEYKLDEINSTLTPWFEFQGAYTFGRRGQFSDGSLASDIHGLSGGIEAGFDFRMASGASVSLSGTYDGIGSDYESYGARLRLDLPF